MMSLFDDEQIMRTYTKDIEKETDYCSYTDKCRNNHRRHGFKYLIYHPKNKRWQ